MTGEDIAFVHLGLNKLGGSLVTTIRVLVEDDLVMLLRVAAAINHQGYQRSELGPGVSGVVSMSSRLRKISNDKW